VRRSAKNAVRARQDVAVGDMSKPGFFDGRAVIDDGARVVQLAELLSLRKNCSRCLGMARLSFLEAAPLRLSMAASALAVFEQPTVSAIRFVLRTHWSPLRCATGCLSLVGIEQAISRFHRAARPVSIQYFDVMNECRCSCRTRHAAGKRCAASPARNTRPPRHFVTD